MTPAGRGTLLAGLAIVVLGLALGYPTLTAMGATLLVAVATALVIVGRPPDMTSSRTVRPDRVTAGDTAVTELTITNKGRRTYGAAEGREVFGEASLVIHIPSLEPGESTVIFAGGHGRRATASSRDQSLTVRHGDPIGLARRGNIHSELSRLIVHPKIHDLSPFPSGIRRDLEGLPSGEAAEGGIASEPPRIRARR